MKKKIWKFVEEEAYSLFSKCRPMRRPRHLIGLGLGFIVDHGLLEYNKVGREQIGKLNK
jgi:hypothetical protein